MYKVLEHLRHLLLAGGCVILCGLFGGGLTIGKTVPPQEFDLTNFTETHGYNHRHL